jgi:hypothetical protein
MKQAKPTPNQDRASYRWTVEGTGLLLLIDMVIDMEFSEGHQHEKGVLTMKTLAKMIEAKADGNEKAMANPLPTSDQVCLYIWMIKLFPCILLTLTVLCLLRAATCHGYSSVDSAGTISMVQK